MRIPRVDCFSPYASRQLRQACMDVGFFYLEGHRIPIALQNAVYEQMKQFFHLPETEKRKASADKNMRGWAPMYEETLDPAHQSKGDTKEAYHVCRPSLPDEVHLPLHDTDNVFPDAHTLPQFKAVTTAYFNAMSALGLHVAHLFADAAGSPGYFNAPGMFDRPMAVLRMLHYNAEKSDLEKGVIGAGAHADYGLLTLLSTDTEPGLQIRHQGQWVDVPHLENAFIVNVGDLAERWTNGLFKSTEHRVVNTTGKERYSIPFFFEPNFNCQVTCIPSCMTPDRPAQFPIPILAGENLLQKYRDTHASYT